MWVHPTMLGRLRVTLSASTSTGDAAQNSPGALLAAAGHSVEKGGFGSIVLALRQAGGAANLDAEMPACKLDPQLIASGHQAFLAAIGSETCDHHEGGALDGDRQKLLKIADQFAGKLWY